MPKGVGVLFDGLERAIAGTGMAGYDKLLRWNEVPAQFWRLFDPFAESLHRWHFAFADSHSYPWRIEKYRKIYIRWVSNHYVICILFDCLYLIDYYGRH